MMKANLQEAEKLLHYTWLSVPATKSLLIERNSNRSEYEAKQTDMAYMILHGDIPNNRIVICYVGASEKVVATDIRFAIKATQNIRMQSNLKQSIDSCLQPVESLPVRLFTRQYPSLHVSQVNARLF